MSKPPPCGRNPSTQKNFEKWTNKQLDRARWSHLSDDQYRELLALPKDVYFDLCNQENPDFVASELEFINQEIRRNRVINRVEALGRLTDNHPELRQLALRLFKSRKTGSGRKKGALRKGDPTNDDLRRREATYRDVALIPKIWKKHKVKPENLSAVDIACRRNAVAESDFEKHTKNRSRYRKRLQNDF
jgi:hypothetical protein